MPYKLQTVRQVAEFFGLVLEVGGGKHPYKLRGPGGRMYPLPVPPFTEKTAKSSTYMSEVCAANSVWTWQISEPASQAGKANSPHPLPRPIQRHLRTAKQRIEGRLGFAPPRAACVSCRCRVDNTGTLRASYAPRHETNLVVLDPDHHAVRHLLRAPSGPSRGRSQWRTRLARRSSTLPCDPDAGG